MSVRYTRSLRLRPRPLAQPPPLQHEKGHLEFRERELVRLLETSDGDRDRISQECKEISQQKRQVEEARGALERDLARTSAKNEALLQQVQDKDDLLAKQVSVQRAGDEARKVLEDKLDMYITNGEALQDKLRESGAEMTRGNALITRLQAEVKAQRESIRSKNDSLQQKEAALEAARSKCAEMERQSLRENDATALARTQGETLKRQLDEANERISESAKLIQSNQEVIAYLNEEVNKWQLGLRTGAEVYAVGTELNASTRSNRPSSSFSNVNLVTYSPDTTQQSQSLTFDKDTYLRGVKNLGLGDSFVVGAGGLSSVGDLGLESFEYYAAAEAGPRAGKAGKQYAWQAEDFGLEADE